MLSSKPDQYAVSDLVIEGLGSDVPPELVARWVKTGLRGVKLDASFVNGTWLTTHQAALAFWQAAKLDVADLAYSTHCQHCGHALD